MVQKLDQDCEPYFNETRLRVLQSQRIHPLIHPLIRSIITTLQMKILMIAQIALSMEMSLTEQKVLIFEKYRKCSKRCDISNTMLMDYTIKDLSMLSSHFK